MHNRKYCAKIKTTDTDPDRRFMMEQPILSFLTAYFSDLHIQCRLTDRKQLELADLDLGLRNSILMQEADAQKTGAVSICTEHHLFYCRLLRVQLFLFPSAG